MIKKTLVLTAIIALTTTTAFASTPKAPITNNTPSNVTKPLPPKGDIRKPYAKFEDRLNLTEKQKAQIKKNREADRVKMEPIIKQIQAKEQAKREIIQKYEQTDPQLVKLNSEIKSLRKQKFEIMEQNRKSFEAMLTKEQKAELDKIKAEHKKKFENGNFKHHPKHFEHK